jgi:hypothetical protein
MIIELAALKTSLAEKGALHVKQPKYAQVIDQSFESIFYWVKTILLEKRIAIAELERNIIEYYSPDDNNYEELPQLPVVNIQDFMISYWRRECSKSSEYLHKSMKSLSNGNIPVCKALGRAMPC